MFYEYNFGCEFFQVTLDVKLYQANNQIALILYEEAGTPFATLTTCLDVPLAPDETLVRADSHDFLNFLISNKLAIATLKKYPSGFCEYLVLKIIDLDILKLADIERQRRAEAQV